MPTVRVTDETLAKLRHAQNLLVNLEGTMFSLGETFEEVLDEWLKTAVEVFSEPDYEPARVRELAFEIGVQIGNSVPVSV